MAVPVVWMGRSGLVARGHHARIPAAEKRHDGLPPAAAERHGNDEYRCQQVLDWAFRRVHSTCQTRSPHTLFLGAGFRPPPPRTPGTTLSPAALSAAQAPPHDSERIRLVALASALCHGELSCRYSHASRRHSNRNDNLAVNIVSSINPPTGSVTAAWWRQHGLSRGAVPGAGILAGWWWLTPTPGPTSRWPR